MYKNIFVPVDNSDHSMTCIDTAIHLAKRFDANLVGSHAYAAKLHDYRFKQMEFTLPEEYLGEGEMERQRDIHDTLITMGLELISDSYLVVMEKKTKEAQVPFTPKMYDGKNFKIIVEDINESNYDLVIIGALGLGAVRDSLIGSVCERVVRRVKTDTLVIRNISPIEEQMKPNANGNGDGNGNAQPKGGGIIVALDGSPESFAGLKTALAMGKELEKEVEAVSVYDPYLHYAMFNSLVNVLTEKASKVFKFADQEQLHEEVIDTGLAKIYQSHLEIAVRIADEQGEKLKVTLLDGKAFEKLLQFVQREKPWLLVLGRIGVHSDEDMDIGSNTENLLRSVSCNVLLSSQRYTPDLDVKAEESMTWTEPATFLVDRAPEFARGIARTTIHRWAMERGHSVITTKVVEQAMATILPRSAMQAMGIIAEGVALEQIDFDATDTYICKACGYAARGFKPVVCSVCNAPAERFEKLDKEAIRNLVPLEGGIEEEETFDKVKLKWTSEARATWREMPQGYQKRRAKAQIEKKARMKRLPIITKELVIEVAGATIEDTRVLEERGELKRAPKPEQPVEQELIKDGKFSWTAEAMTRLNRVPEGFMRNITRGRIEECAAGKSVEVITIAVAEEGISNGRKLMEEMITDYKDGKG
ncbi:MAG: universal stress protein, partial [Candidatus Krumholzibacteriota bacterium]|nr:universal stress protein [Candidatus Krumholzibacteriota bacterium]